MQSSQFDLFAHDRRFHPQGYKEGGTCALRDALSQHDKSDFGLNSQPIEAADGVVVEVCDITKQNVDAIVNAANHWMLGGGGVDGAIHKAAGPELLRECAKYPPDEQGWRLKTGDAKITGAGDLPAKYVVHTAGPDCREITDEFEQDAALAASYRNSLYLAAENGAKTIALPSISTGIFGFPLERAAKIAAREILAFRKNHPDVTVKMCLFDPRPGEADRIAGIYAEAFAGEKSDVQDADDASQQPSPPPNLAAHDARFHPKGYKPGDSCKYREALAKGDDADMLENAEASEQWGSIAANQATLNKAPYTLQQVEKILTDDIAKMDKSDVRAYLQGYQELYDREMGGSSAAQALTALAAKLKGNGPTAALLQKHLSAVQVAQKPAGVKTPQEMRDAVAQAYVNAALAFAKSIGAKLPPAPATAAPAQPATAATVPPQPAPAAQTASAPAPSAVKQYGPLPALSNDESSFPADKDFDFDNYGNTTSGYRSAGSGSTNPHLITINGTKYYVKQAGNNPTYTNDAAKNEVNANKFLRMAGLNAPESKLYTHNGINYCVTKAADTAKGEVLSNLNDPKVRAQLAEAYPVMDLMYNTDILMNGDNAFLDKNGDVVFIDNGSSFGRSAQGTRNSVKKFGFDYDKRDDPFSANMDANYGALANHSSQTGWQTALANTILPKEAAKWNLEELVDDAIAQGLVPKSAEQSLKSFAKGLDAHSDKTYPNLRPAKNQQVQQPAPQPVAQPQAQQSQPQVTAPVSAGPALSQSTDPTAKNILSLFEASTRAKGGLFYQNTQNATFVPDGKGGGTLSYPQNAAMPMASTVRRVFSRIAAPLGLSISRPKGTNDIKFTPMTPKQKRAAEALVIADASAAGATAIGALKVGPGVPQAIVNALSPYANGALAPHSMSLDNGTGAVTIVKDDGRYPQTSVYKGVASNLPQVPGYRTIYNGYGFTYLPDGTGTAPQPAATAAPSAAPAQQALWQKRMATLQANTKNPTLSSAYGTVANWLNGAQAQ